MVEPKINRRRFERFAVAPMYSDATVHRVRAGRLEELRGHVYDVSEGGVRVELDEPLGVGEHVNIAFVLPGSPQDDPDAAVHASCEVVRINDEWDDPVAPRMALRVVQYQGEHSRDRLLRMLGGGTLRRAA